MPSRDFEQSVKGRLADERWQLFGKDQAHILCREEAATSPRQSGQVSSLSANQSLELRDRTGLADEGETSYCNRLPFDDCLVEVWRFRFTRSLDGESHDSEENQAVLQRIRTGRETVQSIGKFRSLHSCKRCSGR